MKKLIFLFLILGNLFIRAAEKNEIEYYCDPKWETMLNLFYSAESLNPEDYLNGNSHETLYFSLYISTKLFPCYKAYTFLSQERREILLQELEARAKYIHNVNVNKITNLSEIIENYKGNNILDSQLQIKILKFIEKVALKYAQTAQNQFELFMHIFDKALLNLIFIEHNFDKFVNLKSKL